MTSTALKNNSNIMEWTREKTLFLINEYRARRGLWDMTHDDYRKKEVKQKLLVEVSDSLGGNIPISEIEKKFHTLRTQYHREINRMKRKEPYNSKWFGFKNLQFLSSPKACRTNKARLRSEITEEGTVVTTKMESVIHENSGGGSNNSEEFLTVTTATNRSTPNNSRSQFEKLIEETTKDVEEEDDEDEEDENMETKPKVTYKEITLPMHHGQQSYSAHIHVNPDLSVTATSHDEHQQHNSSDESILPIEMPEDADVYGNDEQQIDTQHHHQQQHHHHHQQQQQQPQPQHHPTQIIKIQKRDAYHNDYYDDSHVATKRIYYDANGKTTTIVTSPTQQIKANVISGGNSNSTATGGVIQQRHITPPNTVNIKGRLHTIKSPQPKTQTQSQSQQAQPQQPGQKPAAPRDAFYTYGEYVANEMRSIVSREILISLKHKINTALFEAHMAELQK